MPKVKSTIRINGSIGDLSLYTLNGKQVVRRKGGPSKSKIMNSPSCRIIKDNMSEFAAASHIAKIYRMSVSRAAKKIGGPYISGRLSGLFRILCNIGSGIRGRRSFEFTGSGEILEDFEFNKATEFKRIFKSDYSVYFDHESKEVAADFLAFNQKRSVSSPKSASHMKFFLLSSVMSNYYYESSLKKYTAVHPELSGIGFVGESEAFEIRNIDHSGFRIINELGADFELLAETAIISSIGILFYEKIGDTLFELEDKKAMRIEKVF